ncbi:hypothetical protein V2G00_004249 [Escherichia coli]|uniref:hypothetical protein n=1 Tax=Escherichia coli TaxID=562 RepID=UPI000944A21B|nr:hypothetical protein [Escherichia coli]EMF1799686.1 hypothetical protein [Escherichia coli]MBW9512188.1 hypothetical protein [Escherichia coli]NWP55347.1 hypothetical protein [Escherichia coli]OKU24055.1 hypothetical protein ACN78_19585 [Escherichia coli]
MRAELYFKKILSRFIRLINEALKWLPFNLVMAPVIFFYFAPDSVITDVIYDWQQSDMSEKMFFVRLYLKAVFVSVFAAVFLKYLCSDAFMPGKCVNKNRIGCNE